MPKIKKCLSVVSGQRIKNCDDCEFYKQLSVDYNLSSPVFSFVYLQTGRNLEKMQKEEKIALFDSIVQRSAMTWHEIVFSPRHGLGQEIIKQSSLKVPIPPVVKKDTNIIALRYNGTKPIVGFRDKNIFHVLWIDWDYKVYSHS